MSGDTAMIIGIAMLVIMMAVGALAGVIALVIEARRQRVEQQKSPETANAQGYETTQ